MQTFLVADGLMRTRLANVDQGRTRLQGEWINVERFSVKPGKVRLTTLKEARDGIDQDTKGRLAQLTTRLTKR